MDCWELTSVVLGKHPRVFLGGGTGLGKSYAALTVGVGGKGVTPVTPTLETPAAEWRGFYTQDKGGGVRWQDGPVTTAMRRGSRLVVNDIHCLGPDLVGMMLPVLDTPESALLTLPTGEVVKPAAGFEVVATSNEPVEDLPEAIADRFPVRIIIDKVAPGALQALPGRIREWATTNLTSQPPQRLPLRQWMAFGTLLDAGLDREIAAFAAFGTAKGQEVIHAIQIASA